jgi:5'-nucleotidase
MDKPLILVTNDDGITAKGIAKLVESAKKFGRVVVVAPDRPQSAMGHAITVNKPLRIAKSKVFEGIEAYTCSGTPVDCIKIAIYEILKQKPDFIFSGINHGSNVSTNILYSGTMSAAVEACLEGIPSAGFSLTDFNSDADFNLSQRVCDDIISKLLEYSNGINRSTCLNVNIPVVALKDYKGLKVCRQAKASWDDQFEKRQDPFGNSYYWITGRFNDLEHSDDTDIWALNNNYASVVPVHFDMTAHSDLNSIKDMIDEK